MNVWDLAGRNLQAKIGGSNDTWAEAEEAAVTIHRGVRIVTRGERAAAQLDSQTLLEGGHKDVLEAIDRWSRKDLPLSEAVSKAQSMAHSYDAWFLGIRPLEVPWFPPAPWPSLGDICRA